MVKAMEIHLVRGRLCIGVLFFIYQHLAIGEICARGLRTEGYTSPSGDVYRKIGSDLSLNCTLYKSNSTINSKQIYWRLQWKNDNIPPLTLYHWNDSVTLIDNWTSQLHLSRVKRGSFNVFCKVDIAEKETDICRNLVHVGDPPVKNTAIHCTSYDFTNITCRWKLPPPDQNFHTTWSFQQLAGGSRRSVLRECEQPIKNYTEGCTFVEKFCAFSKPLFVLTGNNTLGKGVSPYYFEHYRNVILSAPSTLISSNITNSSAILSWNKPIGDQCVQAIRGKNSSPVIDYKITVKNADQKEHGHYETKTHKPLPVNNLIPFTDYFVEVQCRMVDNLVNYTNLWGSSTHTKFKTLSSVPILSPSNLIASVSTNSSLMNVTLYWTGIPKAQHYGRGFKYSISLNDVNNEINSTTNTYFTVRNLSAHSAYMFQVQAMNDAGKSEERTYFYIKAKDVSDAAGFLVSDVIVQEKVESMWNYTVSWATLNKTVGNLTLYWCLGIRSSDGMIQCNDSGVHLESTMSASETNFTINLPDPTPLEHLFGIATMRPSGSQVIVWSQCTIPISRKPLPPLFNVTKSGATWVYLTWMPLNCERRTAYIEGYQLHVHDESGAALPGSPFLSPNNSLFYNVTDLLPNTFYKFGISTFTASGVSGYTLKEIQTGNPHSPSDSGWKAWLAILVVPCIGFLLYLGNCLRRRYRDKTNIVIDVPRGLAEETDVATTDSSGSFVDWPLLNLHSIIDKNAQPKSRGGSDSSGYGHDTECPDDVSSVSSPTGSFVSSHASSQDSGYDLETPTPCEAVNSHFGFGNLRNYQETGRSANNGYVRAAVESPTSELHERSRRDSNPNILEYSRVGSYINPGNGYLLTAASESNHVNAQVPSYTQIVGFDYPQLPANVQTKHVEPQVTYAVISTNVENPLINKHSDSNNATQMTYVTDLQDNTIAIDTEKNVTQNNGGKTGYAQVSVAMEQPPKCDDVCSSVGKIGYVKVTAAVDDLHTPQPSPQEQLVLNSSGNYQQTIPEHQPLAQLSVPDLVPGNSSSGYKCVNEANLVSPDLTKHTPVLSYSPTYSVMCDAAGRCDKPLDQKHVGSGYITLPDSSIAEIGGYVPATNLSALINETGQTTSSNQPFQNSPPSSYKKHYAPVLL